MKKSVRIKNIIEITGDKDDVEDALFALFNDEGKVDFNEVAQIDWDVKDVEFNDYYNAVLNLWLKKHEEVDKTSFIDTMKFVGYTREHVYDFHKLSDNELNVYRSKYKKSKMLEDADKIIEGVKKKSLFNGYFARTSIWGTGSQPIEQKKKGNRVEFVTFNTPALKVIEKLAKKYPKVRIYYTYMTEEYDNGISDNIKIVKNINKVTFKGDKIEPSNGMDVKFDTFQYIKDNVNL